MNTAAGLPEGAAMSSQAGVQGCDPVTTRILDGLPTEAQRQAAGGNAKRKAK